MYKFLLTVYFICAIIGIQVQAMELITNEKNELSRYNWNPNQLCKRVKEEVYEWNNDKGEEVYTDLGKNLPANFVYSHLLRNSKNDLLFWFLIGSLFFEGNFSFKTPLSVDSTKRELRCEEIYNELSQENKCSQENFYLRYIQTTAMKGWEAKSGQDFKSYVISNIPLKNSDLCGISENVESFFSMNAIEYKNKESFLEKLKEEMSLLKSLKYIEKQQKGWPPSLSLCGTAYVPCVIRSIHTIYSNLDCQQANTREATFTEHMALFVFVNQMLRVAGGDRIPCASVPEEEGSGAMNIDDTTLSKHKALVLFAHKYDPKSLFFQLPIEILCEVIDYLPRYDIRTEWIYQQFGNILRSHQINRVLRYISKKGRTADEKKLYLSSKAYLKIPVDVDNQG